MGLARVHCLFSSDAVRRRPGDSDRSCGMEVVGLCHPRRGWPRPGPAAGGRAGGHAGAPRGRLCARGRFVVRLSVCRHSGDVGWSPRYGEDGSCCVFLAIRLPPCCSIPSLPAGRARQKSCNKLPAQVIAGAPPPPTSNFANFPAVLFD